jgi:hypothetical protein
MIRRKRITAACIALLTVGGGRLVAQGFGTFCNASLPDSSSNRWCSGMTHSPWGGRWIGVPESVESAVSRSIAARICWRVAALRALPVGQGPRPDWGTERPPRRRRPRAGGSRLPVH